MRLLSLPPPHLRPPQLHLRKAPQPRQRQLQPRATIHTGDLSAEARQAAAEDFHFFADAKALVGDGYRRLQMGELADHDGLFFAEGSEAAVEAEVFQHVVGLEDLIVAGGIGGQKNVVGK